MARALVRRAALEDACDLWRLIDRYQNEIHVVLRDERDDVIAFLEVGGIAVLAQLDERFVGCAIVRGLPGRSQAGELKRLYVVPQARRAGIAAEILERTVAEARDAGYAWLYLDTTSEMHAARALYERAGFAACERYNDNVQADVFMRMKL